MTALRQLLRCPLCLGPLSFDAAGARCENHRFPVENGVPRLLPPDLLRVREGEASDHVRARTYRSFGFEWESFSQQLPSYEENFRWYLEPLDGLSLDNLVVLDAGCGMGRHTSRLLARGAEVVAVDASSAIDVAAEQNSTSRALFTQGDVLQLPLASDSFDVACCLGVLHHIEDPEGGLRELVRVTKPGGWILIYVYHDPSATSMIRGSLLSVVAAMRLLTTRMPLRVLRILCWVLAAALYSSYIVPLRVLSRSRRLRSRAMGLPLGQYVGYPFRVLWNDQLDRLSAPLERRYTKDEVVSFLAAAGLSGPRLLGGYGWRAAVRKKPRS